MEIWPHTPPGRNIRSTCDDRVDRSRYSPANWNPSPNTISTSTCARPGTRTTTCLDDGRNVAAMGGVDWEPGQSVQSEVARTAMVTNLLTEDNLPSDHQEISESFSLDGVWGTWVVARRTAEEDRHAIVMRDYLVNSERARNEIVGYTRRIRRQGNAFRGPARSRRRQTVTASCRRMRFRLPITVAAMAIIASAAPAPVLADPPTEPRRSIRP